MIKDLALYLWMVPPIVVFLIFGALVAFSSVSPVSPFIYMLF